MSTATVLVVDDDAGLRTAIVDTLKLAGYNCAEASDGTSAMATLARRKVDMVVSDVQMAGMDGHTLLKNIAAAYPELPVLLMTAYANIDGAVKAMRDGAVDYLSKPFSPEVLLNQVSRYVPAETVESKDPVYGDASTAALFSLAAKVAKSDATVMVTGPSGSGKEVLSRFIHDHSPRSEGPFVAINCAAIPESMLEATLFGYEKGAFTGAVQSCPGKFEQAQDGTILLDEITEMDLSLQAKLLRVLQEREVERLGSRKSIKLNVRVIATSNRNLQETVAEHKFREDLYYRLNVFPLSWRPLRERPGDILPLAKHLLALHATENSSPIPELLDDAAEALLAYSFPGNVRELDNIMQRALILANEGKISANELMLEGMCGDIAEVMAQTLNPVISGIVNATNTSSKAKGRESDAEADEVGSFAEDKIDSPAQEKRIVSEEADTGSSQFEGLGSELRMQESQIILDALKACQGSRKAVAERLGISPRTLRYKLAKMRESGIEIPESTQFDKPLPDFS